MQRVDETCRRGVSAGAFPGAVVLAADSEGILFHGAYGHRALAPERLPMMPDTVFDLSSLTKPLATTTAMMLLVRDGRLHPDDRVCTVIPEFSRGARTEVTFRQLLNHTSGLPAWKPYYESVIPAGAGIRGRRGAMAVPSTETAGALSGVEAGARRRRCFERVHDEALVAPPGEKVCYSDLGFILLGEAVERLSGRPLDRFCRDEIFAPMGLPSTFFVDLSGCPPEPRPVPGRTVAATEDCPGAGRYCAVKSTTTTPSPWAGSPGMRACFRRLRTFTVSSVFWDGAGAAPSRISCPAPWCASSWRRNGFRLDRPMCWAGTRPRPRNPPAAVTSPPARSATWASPAPPSGGTWSGTSTLCS